MHNDTESNDHRLHFIEAILGGFQVGFAELRGPALGSHGRWGQRWYELADPRALGALSADSVELAKGGDVYLGTAPRMRRRGRVEDVGQGRVLAIDIDAPEAVKALADFTLPPSITMRTGSVTNGVPHIAALWLLSRPADPQTISELQRRLRDHLGGDSGYNASAATVARMPGTFNLKSGKPVPVELASFTPDRTYAVEEIEVELPKARRPVRLPRPTPQSGNSEETIRRALAAVEVELREGGHRNEIVFKVGTKMLWEGGLSESEALNVAADFAELATRIAPSDHPYLQPEAEASIRSRFQRGVRVEIPSEIEEIERAAIAEAALSPSERATLQALIRRAKGAGRLAITASSRQLAEGAGRDRKTVERALKRLRLKGWLKRTGKGAKGASRFKLAKPSSTPSLYVSLGASCPSPFSALHEAFEHGGLPLLTLQILASQTEPVAAADLADLLPSSPKTIRRHLCRLAEFGLAVEALPGCWQADLEGAGAKLDRAAEALGIAGRGERRQRRHEIERGIFREAQDRFAVERERKRQVEAKARMNRVCSRRHRKPRTLNVHESARVDGRRFTVPSLPSDRRPFRVAHLPPSIQPIKGDAMPPFRPRPALAGSR